MMSERAASAADGSCNDALLFTADNRIDNGSGSQLSNAEIIVFSVKVKNRTHNRIIELILTTFYARISIHVAYK